MHDLNKPAKAFSVLRFARITHQQERALTNVWAECSSGPGGEVADGVRLGKRCRLFECQTFEVVGSVGQDERRAEP